MVKEFEESVSTDIGHLQDMLQSKVEEPICALKNNKSLGSDGTTTRMLQTQGE